jgi:hypothetical protein
MVGASGRPTAAGRWSPTHEPYLRYYRTSIKISLVTALLGGLLGFLIAYAASLPGAPRGVRSALSTFSGVAANFGGIPLAFAFIATIGTLGIVTNFLRDQLGWNIYRNGPLYSTTGSRLSTSTPDPPDDLSACDRRLRRSARGCSLGAAHPVLAVRRLPILRPPAGAVILLRECLCRLRDRAHALPGLHGLSRS